MIRHIGTIARVGAIAAALTLATGCQREGTAWCHQFVDAYAEWAVGCGHASTHEEAEEQILRELRNTTPAHVQSCENIWGIRDRVSFRDECLPTIRAMPCDGAELPASCERQLLYEE